jgi:hypothetical protein
MADGVGAIIKGVGEVGARLTEMQVASNEGTRVALNKATSYTKRRIKGGMHGRPRWDRKGRDKVTGQFGVNLNLSPHVVRKSGGPGEMTGQLVRSIRKSKRARAEGIGRWSQVVMSGGDNGYQNRYKRTVEAKYPFFKPGVDKAKPKVRAMFEGAWAASTSGKRIGR